MSAALALITAPVPPPPAEPTLTTIASEFTSSTPKLCPDAGSVVRGYRWVPLWLSLEQVNPKELLAIWTVLTALERPPVAAAWNACTYSPPDITAPAVADTNVCLVVFVDGIVVKTCKVIDVSVTDCILIAVLCTGSLDLGYVLLVALLSTSQVNVSELATSLILDPAFKLWAPISNSIKPVVGS